MKYKSDLKHTSTAKSRAEEQEKKARDELRVADCKLGMVRDELQIARGELRVVRFKQQADKEELQVARDELHLKTTTLIQVCQEVA